MNPYYPHLFSPLKVGKVTFRNRILGSPNTTMGDLLSQIAFSETHAKGGAAQVTLAESSVTGKYMVEEPDCAFVLDDVRQYTKLAEFATVVKALGAVPSIELNHHGQYARVSRSGGRLPIGPTCWVRPDGVQVVEMDEATIDEAIEDYANAAAFAKRAGLDMVMVHLGHGWLPSQFLSPYTNKRRDRWGGSFENRARFSLEILKRIREKCGDDFLIEARISGEEFMPGGMHIEDAIRFATYIEPYIDLVHVSAGVHDDPFTINRMFPIMSFTEPGCNVEFAAEVKKHVKIPVVTVGGITTPELAEQILSEGKADFIAMCRPLIADPDFPNKARKGQRNDIVPCMRCNTCIAQTFANFGFICSVNPRAGREVTVSRLEQPKGSRRVVVVGGGPGGMTAAITAAERGHQVTLLEKSSVLGGLLNYAGQDDKKYETTGFKNYLIAKLHRTVEDVRLNTPATRGLVASLQPDAVIMATGSRPLVPKIPGTEGNVMTCEDAYFRTATVGEKVVVVGGGLIGCETAKFLARQGRRVTMIEMRGKIGVPNYHHYNVPLVDWLEKSENVSIKVNATCLAVTPEGVLIATPNGEELVTGDSVVFAVGLAANDGLRDELYDIAGEFYQIGDCNRPERIPQATQGGYFAAMSIL